MLLTKAKARTALANDEVDSILDELRRQNTAQQPPSQDGFESVNDLLDSLPTAVSVLDDIVDYPASTYPGEETVVISTRVPISLMSQFEEFRDKIGSRMPKEVWKKNSDLLRWCVMDSFKKLRGIQEMLDKGEAQPSPLLAAQLFLEQTGGKLVAHANVRADAREKANRTGELLRDMVANREYTVAANVVTDWFEGARKLRDISTYWEATMISSLLHTPEVPRIILKLCQGGHITDPEILDLYEGLVEAAQQQKDDLLDSLPTSTQGSSDDSSSQQTTDTR